MSMAWFVMGSQPCLIDAGTYSSLLGRKVCIFVVSVQVRPFCRQMPRRRLGPGMAPSLATSLLHDNGTSPDNAQYVLQGGTSAERSEQLRLVREVVSAEDGVFHRSTAFRAVRRRRFALLSISVLTSRHGILILVIFCCCSPLCTHISLWK